MVRLGDVANFRRGSFPQPYGNREWYDGDGAMPFVQVADVGDDMALVPDTKQKISKIAQPKSVFVPTGTVIITLQGSIGRVAITQYDCYVDRTLAIFESFKIPIDKTYFAYQLQKKFAIEKLIARGITIKTITKEEFASFEIPLPPLHVQQKIADTLGSAKSLIEKRKAQIEKLDLLVKSQFIEMFGDPVTNPKGWEVKRLGEACNIITGNTPPRADKENYGNYIEWIKSDNINTPNTYLTKATEHISKQGFTKCRYVEKDSILMTCIAGSVSCIGNIAIADRRISFNQQINAIVSNSNHHLFLYWMLLLSKPYIQSTVSMSLKGILSKSKLSELEFIFPPYSTQTNFADFVERVEEYKAKSNKSLELMELNYKSLMQKCLVR